MANTLQLRRRQTGAVGAPATLKPGEVAFNELDRILYYGFGSNAGNAASIIGIAGEGFAVAVGAISQTIAGTKTFLISPVIPTPAPGDNSTKAASTAFVANAIASLGAGDMLKSVYDTTNNGIVDNAEKLGGVLPAAYALLASPTFTGAPLSSTPVTTDNTTKIATTAFVNALITSLKGALNGLASLDASGTVPSSQLPSYVDDVLEYATQANFPGTGEAGKIYLSLATNLTFRWSGTTYTRIAAGDVSTVFGRSGNIVATLGDYGSDLINNNSAVIGSTITAALTTLANAITSINATLATHGTMALQNANAVNITGGTIDGTTIDCGTF